MATTPLLASRKPDVVSYGATPTTPAKARGGPHAASLLSRCFFSYATPLMVKGNQRSLTEHDLWELTGENTTAAAHAAFQNQFNAARGSLPRAIFATYGWTFFWNGVASLFSVGCTVFAPAVLHHVIDAFAAPQIDVGSLLTWLGAFFAYKLADAFVSVHTRYALELAAMRMTASLKGLLFEKAMTRAQRARQDAGAVDIANLVASDVNNVLWASYQINNMWVVPIQVVAVIWMLYGVLGFAAFAGLGVLVVTMIAGFFITKVSGESYARIMVHKDTRMKAIKEFFGAIQIVKLNAWETKANAKIHTLRVPEMSAIAGFLYMVALSYFVTWASPLFVSITSFAVYAVAIGQTLTAAKVFTSIALFNALRTPLQVLPYVISQCIQAKIALDRMASFLEQDDVDVDAVTRDGSAYPKDVMIDVKNGSFGWNKEIPILKNVNMTVTNGDFVVIHGAVGSGKSSLCSALLGEMDKLSGTVFVRGRVAYYSQQTWIQNMTIRDNILFGKAYDEKLYQRVLDACGLLPDLAGFPAGDSTEIGQKGVNLSGGQKARLCLARACYADADVLILDSPLAAVDAVVQSEIFSKCLCGLLESKTVVLVTHAPDIIASEATNYKLEVVDGVVSGDRRDAVKPRSSFATYSQRRTEHSVDVPSSSKMLVNDEEAGRLVDDEDRQEGRVSKDVFVKYLDALGGVRIGIFIVVIELLWQGLQISSDFWLSHWTSQKLGADDEETTEYNMLVYGLLALGSACMVLVREVTTALIGLKAARHLFDSMTCSLLHAPLRFFDANPIGRILNRYGDDMSSVDFRLPFSFGQFLSTLFFSACQLAAAVYMVNIVGVLILPLLYIYVSVANFYLAPSREISRLTKIAESPVLSHVASCEEGAEVLRAFGSAYVHSSVTTNTKLNDAHNRVWLAEAIADSWFKIRMQLIGCGLVMVIISTLVSLHGILSPGMVGLAFTYALSVDAGLSDVVYSWSWVEICMVSPERILEYIGIPAEGDSKVLQIEPSPQWPQRGTIDFDNVVFAYKEGAPPVLKGLSFSIQNNEKIGIVGRTGAGKSSLTMALFRINELVSGRVSIDGVNISTMPLHSLRSRLSIIPQSPVLFKGPLRAYMDPFDEYTDEQIWTAFEKVEMKDQIVALEGQLSHELSENGENFSVGERQMLCMARAMLTKSRIVVMDEATASIDHATEKKLQHMINRDFQEATVLTIAHRLATVLDSDRIMVLSDGRVMEFDTPANLVKNTDGMFYALAREGGVLESITSSL